MSSAVHTCRLNERGWNKWALVCRGRARGVNGIFDANSCSQLSRIPLISVKTVIITYKPILMCGGWGKWNLCDPVYGVLSRNFQTRTNSLGKKHTVQKNFI